ncbi:hypothetical protein L917_12953 [Phytophthora nicotianae]|uniref:Uncharacterized protein n=1 Tax=Phytophthora nicotianae TaxID=4792 RepID=W2KS12_PHYNI|nr:hypothetical protein L917_12953 [Phytophthora nicotianae]
MNKCIEEKGGNDFKPVHMRKAHLAKEGRLPLSIRCSSTAAEVLSLSVVPQFFGQEQPAYGIHMSELQRLYSAVQARGPVGLPMEPRAPQLQPGAQRFPVQHQNGVEIRYPDARQKKLAIRPFDKKELYVGLGSGFLEWGKRFERQVNIAQSASERYYNKQVDAWWSQLPTLKYVMEKILETFKTNITPAQVMKLFAAPKDSRRTWPEHYIYLLQSLRPVVAVPTTWS